MRRGRRTFFDEDAARRLPTVILEGCDGSGKTTAITRLDPDPRTVLLLRQGEYRAVPDGRLWLRNLACLLVDTGYDRARVRALDRGWQSDAVYSPVHRGHPSRISVPHERMLERVALASAAVAVYCLPDFDTCLRGWAARPHDEFLQAEAHLREVYDRYRAAADTGRRFVEHHRHRAVGGLPAITYDWERGDQPENLLERAAERRELLGLTPAVDDRGRPWPGIGAFRPGAATLLVGEGPNPRASDGIDSVFVGPGGSATWLAERLEAWAVPELDLYWANALSWLGDELVFTSPTFVHFLRPKRVVALGAAAHEWLEAHGIEHRRVPHPQYWRRFEASRADAYPLREALS